MSASDQPYARWQWHGRYCTLEARNDWRGPKRFHRVVYHIADVVHAPNEVAALVAMQARYPECQTTGFFHLGPVRKEKTRR